MFAHLRRQFVKFVDLVEETPKNKPADSIGIRPQIEQLDCRVMMNAVLTLWQDSSYGSNPYGAESATVGLSHINTDTGAETKLYTQNVPGVPQSSYYSPPPINFQLAMTPGGEPLQAGNRAFIYGSDFGAGTTKDFFGNTLAPARDDQSRLVSIDLVTGQSKQITLASRAITTVGLTDDNQLIVGWQNGTFGTNPYGPESMNVGVSRVDPVSGGETELFRAPVAGYPSSNYDYSYSFGYFSGLIQVELGSNGKSILAGGRIVVYTNRDGSSQPLRQDASKIFVVNASTGASTVVSDQSRIVDDITRTTDDNLLVSWHDGTYTTNPYGSSYSSVQGLSWQSATSATEVVISTSAKDQYRTQTTEWFNGDPILVGGKQLAVITQDGHPTNPYAAQDDSTTILSIQSAGASSQVATIGLYTEGLGKSSDGNLLLIDYRDATYGMNPYGPESATVGVLSVNVSSKAQAILYSEAVPGLPRSGSTNPYGNYSIASPTLLVNVNGSTPLVAGNYVYFDSDAGSPAVPGSTNPYSPPPVPAQQDSSRIILVGQTVAAADKLLQAAAREIRDIGVNAAGNVIVSWYDGVYGMNPYGPASATRGVSIINSVSGSEQNVFSETVPGLPRTSYTNPYGSSFDYYEGLQLVQTANGNPAEIGGKLVVVDNNYGSTSSQYYDFSTNPYGELKTNPAVQDSGRIYDLLGNNQTFQVAGGSRTFNSVVPTTITPNIVTTPPTVPPPTTVPPTVPPPTTVPPTVPPPTTVPPTVPPTTTVPPSTPRPNPNLGTAKFAVGGANGTLTVFNSDRSVSQSTFNPLPGFTGTVRVVTADFNGDGTPDVAVGTGAGASTRVIVFDGITFNSILDFAPFEASFTGGVFVTAGDVNADGRADLVITPDEGGGPRVRVFNGDGFGLIADFFGIDDSKFRGGARAALGDVTGDGVPDLIISAGFGGGPRVAIYDGTSLRDGKFTVKPVGDFFVYEDSLRNGAYVSVGDVTGDGRGDLITGAGPGGGPRVIVYDGASIFANPGSTPTPKAVSDFFAGDTSNRDGVRVTVKNLDNDSNADLITAPGSGKALTGYFGKSLLGGGTPEGFTLDNLDGGVGGIFIG